MANTRIQFRIPDDVYADLKRISEETGQPLNTVVVEAIKGSLYGDKVDIITRLDKLEKTLIAEIRKK